MKRILFIMALCLPALFVWAEDDVSYRLVDTTMVFSEEEFYPYEYTTGIYEMKVNSNNNNNYRSFILSSDKSYMPWWYFTFELSKYERVSTADITCEYSDEVLYEDNIKLYYPGGANMSERYMREDYPLWEYAIIDRNNKDAFAERTDSIVKTGSYMLHTSPFRYDYQTKKLYLRKKVRVQIRVTVQPTPIYDYAVRGRVVDQDHNPISNAAVTARFVDTFSYPHQVIDSTQCFTDADGYYHFTYRSSLTGIDGSLVVQAPGHTASYGSFSAYQGLVDGPIEMIVDPEEIMLYNALVYPAEKIGTIMLPVAPDASLGKYYRIHSFSHAGTKVDQIYFMREQIPAAYIPYIFIPYQDTRIDISDMNLDPAMRVSRTAYEGSDRGCSRIWFDAASYSGGNRALSRIESPLEIDENGKLISPSHIWQAMRAYLILDYYPLDSNDRPQVVLLEPGEKGIPFMEDDKIWKTVEFGKNGLTLNEYRFMGRDSNGWDPDGMSGLRLAKSHTDGLVPLDTCHLGMIAEVGGKVYFNECQDGTPWNLLYDFESPVGAELTIEGEAFTITHREKDMVNGYKGNCVKIQRKGSDETVTWMDGVGSAASPLRNLEPLSPYVQTEILLSCSYVNTGEVLYLNPQYDEISGVDVDGQTSTGAMRVKRRRIDFTHTIKIRPHAPRLEKALGAAGAQEPTLSGSYSAFDFVVNFGQLDGVYDVTLLNADDVILYRGSLQANRFVALTRELRNYPQGTYRLIVENDEDLYSATLTLPFDDTAIHSPQSSIINHQYFDLSGRRLVTPPTRGLFIRDGKVVIK